jgi:hypothetical protein
MNHREYAIRARGKYIARLGVVRCSAHAGADRRCGDISTGLVVRDREYTAATTTEQAMMCLVDGHCDGLTAGFVALAFFDSGACLFLGRGSV